VKPLFATLAILLLAGCAYPTSPTRSGRPEISSSGSSQDLKRAIVEVMVNAQYLPTSSDPETLTFEGEASMGAQFWYTNTLTGARPRNRFRFNIIDQGDKRRVISSWFLVTPGNWSGQNEREQFNNGAILQMILEGIKQHVESGFDLPVMKHPNNPDSAKYPQLGGRP